MLLSLLSSLHICFHLYLFSSFSPLFLSANLESYLRFKVSLLTKPSISDILSSGTCVLLTPFLRSLLYSLLHSLWPFTLRSSSTASGPSLSAPLTCSTVSGLSPTIIFLVSVFWFLFLSVPSHLCWSLLCLLTFVKREVQCQLGDRVFCCGSCRQ